MYELPCPSYNQVRYAQGDGMSVCGTSGNKILYTELHLSTSDNSVTLLFRDLSSISFLESKPSICVISFSVHGSSALACSSKLISSSKASPHLLHRCLGCLCLRYKCSLDRQSFMSPTSVYSEFGRILTSYDGLLSSQAHSNSSRKFQRISLGYV